MTQGIAVSEQAADQLERKAPNIFQRLGRFRAAIIALGFLLNLGALAFLWFLWTAKDSNDVWERIVLANWTTRVITLTSLLIRFIITAQAAICTSILATLILHKYGVLLPDSAAVSLMQFENRGPHALIAPILSSLRRTRGFAVATPLFMLFSTTTLLQFSSTILLSDINLAPVTDYGKQAMLYYGYTFGNNDIVDLFLEKGYWQRKPNTFPAFAEDSQQPDQIPGTHDTGRSLRAFLPVYPEFQRDSLKAYDGMALVFDSRFVCVQPTLEDFEVIWDSNSYAAPAPRLRGRIGADVQFEGFQTDDRNDHLQPFDCGSAVQFTENEWPLAACFINQTSGIVSSLDDNQDGIEWYMQNGPGRAFLVVNTTGSYDRWSSYYYETYGLSGFYGTEPIEGSLQFVEQSNYEKDEEWLRIPTNDPAIAISFSLCYAAFETIDVAVHASSDHNRTEAVLEWDHTNAKYDTRAVREQLGAVSNPKALGERGILELNLGDFSKTQVVRYGPTVPQFIVSSTYPNINEENSFDFTTYMCISCNVAQNGSRYDRAHAVLATLFYDVIKDTGHPALALQAVWTTIFGMSYYDHIEQFDYNGSSTVVGYKDVLVPTSMRALIIISVILLVHLLLVLAIVIAFAMSKKPGMIGNSWGVVGQLQGDTVQTYTKKYSSLRDGQVKAKMKEEGVDSVWVGLSARARGGRVLVGLINDDS
jgi:hypothetical protein